MQNICLHIFLFLLMQSKYTDTPLMLLFLLQYCLLQPSPTSIESAVTILLLQETSFFALKKSNSLSSIDLSNSYNGVGGYNVIAVGALTYISNWAGPIWWCVASHKSQRHISTVKVLSFLSLFHGTVMCFLLCSCTILRSHLFIWTVFSPKVLFQTVWCCLLHWCVTAITQTAFSILQREQSVC